MPWNALVISQMKYSHKRWLGLLCEFNSFQFYLHHRWAQCCRGLRRPCGRRGSPQTEAQSEPPPQMSHYQATWTVEKRYRKRINVKVKQERCRQRSGSYWVIACAKPALLLVTEVGTVLVVSAQVSIIRWRGTEEDSRRQVVAPVFEELIHLTGNTWLNRYSVT